MSPKLSFFFSRIFPLIFLAAGLIALTFGLRGVLRARESADWPGVPGVVTSSEVERHESTSTSDGHTRTTVTYHAEIRYRYSIDGESFEGDRVAYGDYGSGNRGHAEEIVARYPVGVEVTVFHRPRDPGESVLETGLQAQAWLLPGMGVVFTLAGILLAVVLPRAMRAQADRLAGSESESEARVRRTGSAES